MKKNIDLKIISIPTTSNYEKKLRISQNENKNIEGSFYMSKVQIDSDQKEKIKDIFQNKHYYHLKTNILNDKLEKLKKQSKMYLKHIFL